MELSPREYHHPFQPYEIQYQLMDAIYDCISLSQIGIFESPTGTGKSLSLLCSTLTWLRDEQEKRFIDALNTENDDGEPMWVVEQSRNQRKEALIQERSKMESRLARIREKESRQKQRYEGGEPVGKRKKIDFETNHPQANDDDESQFILEDYDSENEIRKKESNQNCHEGLSVATRQLMEKFGEPVAPLADDQDLDEMDGLKVFFCSRTHSQLTQFVKELRRLSLPPVSLSDSSLRSPKEIRQESTIKHLPLGARNSLCINPKVLNAGSAATINERCLDLQSPSVPKDKKCSFLPSKANEYLVNEFRDYALAKIRDIEDLGDLGRKIGICPYYSVRATIKPSEIVTLPYPLLLQRSAREALGISLTGHVVIIDEAHNLMDAIANIFSVKVSRLQLRRCRMQLSTYLQKFRNKLKGKNRVYVAQVVRLIDSISSHLETIANGTRSGEGIVQTSDLMAGKGVDQINLHKLLQYLELSKLARKVEGFIDYQAKQRKSKEEAPASSTPVLTHVQGILQTLMNPASEGRFFYEQDGDGDILLKYMLLDPEFHFRQVVEEARSVILAGGTMAPMDDYVRHLFSYVAPERLKTWSCGHIIPKENLIVWPVSQGSSNAGFDFTFEKRSSISMVDELGISLARLSQVIPDGLVVFFPSYSYLDQVTAQWQKENGAASSIWNQLSRHKSMFQEFKDSRDAIGVNEILHEYSKSIDEGKGAILLSVMGGKLSEGINFSDKLGRGVVVVGLPFPNIQSAQWKSKLEYIEQKTMNQGGSREKAKAAGREFYENACMRAVNQSIGRAIRHQKDFASIILLDRRYSMPRIADKLPGWIKQGIAEENRSDPPFDDILQSLQNFFSSKT